MKNFIVTFTIALTSLWIHSPALAQPDCEKYIQAFNLWEDEIDGQIVLKHSLFPLVDWDPNSQFEGVVLTTEAKAVKKPLLEVEYKANSKNGKRKLESFRRVQAFAQEPTLNTFEDFKAEDFFNFKEAGTYTVRLKDDGALICSQNFKYNLGH